MAQLVRIKLPENQIEPPLQQIPEVPDFVYDWDKLSSYVDSAFGIHSEETTEFAETLFNSYPHDKVLEVEAHVMEQGLEFTEAESLKDRSISENGKQLRNVLVTLAVLKLTKLMQEAGVQNVDHVGTELSELLEEYANAPATQLEMINKYFSMVKHNRYFPKANSVSEKVVEYNAVPADVAVETQRMNILSLAEYILNTRETGRREAHIRHTNLIQDAENLSNEDRFAEYLLKQFPNEDPSVKEAVAAIRDMGVKGKYRGTGLLDPIPLEDIMPTVLEKLNELRASRDSKIAAIKEEAIQLDAQSVMIESYAENVVGRFNRREINKKQLWSELQNANPEIRERLIETVHLMLTGERELDTAA